MYGMGLKSDAENSKNGNKINKSARQCEGNRNLEISINFQRRYSRECKKCSTTTPESYLTANFCPILKSTMYYVALHCPIFLLPNELAGTPAGDTRAALTASAFLQEDVHLPAATLMRRDMSRTHPLS